jgi:hypothetical protein
MLEEKYKTPRKNQPNRAANGGFALSVQFYFWAIRLAEYKSD